MGFWVAHSDASGARVTDSEVLLSPGPTRPVYPQESQGTVVETDDGGVVHQQSSLDGRRRQWEWVGYPYNQAGYQRVWPLLESLRSVYLADMGLSPYVFLKEDVSLGLRRRFTLSGTATATGFTLTDGAASWTPNALAGGFVIIAGQARAILGNAATTLTVGDAFVGSLSTTYNLSYWAADWFRARVLEVSRQTQDSGGVTKFPSSRIVFAIDDDNSRDLLG